MMNRKTIISIVVILTFLTLRYIKYVFAYLIFGKEAWNEMDFHLKVSILNYSQIIIVFVVTALLFKKLPFEFLGLKNDLLKGFLYGFLFTVPMFLGYGYMAGFKTDISLTDVHMDMVLAGFFEEFLFRGFVFGILYYYAGWGFISAVLIPSVFFGIAHLYQAETFSDGIGVFIFTILASAGFAWFYIAWKSLWMVIFLHGFMDLAWDMFSVQSNVTGDMNSNIFRFATLGIAIFFSVKKAKAENNY
jgi:hypothetical protein